MSDFPKQYDPKINESQAQALWEEKKIYRPQKGSSVFQNGSNLEIITSGTDK
jgi:valyl-tRNA synthetase